MGLLLTMSTVAYAVGMVTQGEQYTEFYLLTENESGDITARNYPTEFRRGESKHLVVGIHNHEHQTANYTVVAMIQRVSDGNSSTTVRNQEDQGRFSVTITHNETRYRRMQIKPRLTGDRLRLVFLLYRGTLPDDPTVANAYRTLHLRVNVSTG